MLASAASSSAGAFFAAPDNPYEFLQGIRGFAAWLDFAKPRPVFRPRRFAPLTGAGASAFPRTPLAAGGKERVSWLPPTFKLTAPAVASASVCDLAAYCSPSGRSHAGCALAGDPLAISVCRQKPFETV